MCVPSANTRASRNVSSTASQPLIEKPASISSGYAGARNDLRDRGDDDAEKLQREQDPGDRLQTLRVRGDERVARANRLNHREQPFEERRSSTGSRTRPTTAIACRPTTSRFSFRRRRKAERGPDPLTGGHGDQQNDDPGTAQPVQDYEDPQHDVRDRQRGGRLGFHWYDSPP